MPTSPNKDLAKGLETETCGRCGGCGQYSYCQMYGTVCFGCAGSGVKLTKRGHATREYFCELLTVPVTAVQVGWVARSDSNHKWFPVREVNASRLSGASLINGVMTPYDRESVNVVYGRTVHAYFADCRVIAAPSMEVVREKLQLAYAYQQTLTQKGVPSKRTPAKQEEVNG